MSVEIATSNNTGLRSEFHPSFIDAMKTLFDIMDVNKSGMIRLCDIETRWQEDPRKGLPKGVIENLRKVTPPTGFITFSQFCTGLKLSVARSKTEVIINKDVNNNSKESRQCPPVKPIPTYIKHPPATLKKPETQRIPTHNEILTSNNKQLMESNKMSPGHKNLTRSVSSCPSAGLSHPNTAKVKPNNTIAQRATSMPHLGDKYSQHNLPGFVSPPPFIPPPPPNKSSGPNMPYYNHNKKDAVQKIELALPPNCPPSALNKSGIMTVLHKWRLEKLKENKDVESTDSDATRSDNNDKNYKMLGTQLSGNFHRLLSEAPPKPPRLDRQTHAISDNGQGLASDSGIRNLPLKKTTNRRKEPRRHTLANGIDYNMLKRMKQMEQEKDILVQGLESVDKAREWYLKQIQTVQDKMKYIGRIGTATEPSSEAYQERLNFQMARIFEVNQHLSALVESTDKGFPLHMNLALRQPAMLKMNKSAADDSTVQRLKQQNTILSEDISKKDERITQLEREKAALIRELFQARSAHRRDSDDNTLM